MESQNRYVCVSFHVVRVFMLFPAAVFLWYLRRVWYWYWAKLISITRRICTDCSSNVGKWVDAWPWVQALCSSKSSLRDLSIWSLHAARTPVCAPPDAATTIHCAVEGNSSSCGRGQLLCWSRVRALLLFLHCCNIFRTSSYYKNCESDYEFR